jgi:hypothetical protein
MSKPGKMNQIGEDDITLFSSISQKKETKSKQIKNNRGKKEI